MSEKSGRTTIEVVIPLETASEAIARHHGDAEGAIAARDQYWREAVGESLGGAWTQAYQTGRADGYRDGLAVTRQKRLVRDAEGRVERIIEEASAPSATEPASKPAPVVGFASTSKRGEG